MDIYDIIIEPPNSAIDIVININFIAYSIIGFSLFIATLIIIYYRRFIALSALYYLATLLKHKHITYKQFAFLLARILRYRHKTTRISKEDPPIKSSKAKHYLWIGLVDALNDVRYGKIIPSNQPESKLYKTAKEWLRQS